MSDKITKVRIKQADGTFSAAIPIGVEGANVSLSSGVTLQDTISGINTKLGSEDISDAGTSVTNAINSLNQSLENTTKMEATYLTEAYTFGGTTQDNHNYFGIEFDRGNNPDDRFRFQIYDTGLLSLYQLKADSSGWTSLTRLFINDAITNITRSGTTFTATRGNGTTFTFDQQDNNTWNANSATVAGYVAAPTSSKPRYFYSTDNNGTPAWRNNINFTGASSSANGTLGLVPAPTSGNYANRTFIYLRSDGGWNYLPLANNATTTAEHYALDARMGKTLNDKITPIGTGSRNSTLLKTTCSNSWTNLASITLAAGTWIIMGTVTMANAQNGKVLTIRWSSNTLMRSSCYASDGNIYSAHISDYVQPAASTTYYIEGWCSSSTSLGSCSVAAMRIK